MEAGGHIGWAVYKLRDGYPVRRRGWNGKGMFLALKNPPLKPEAWAMTVPFVYMKTADEQLVPWLCSQTDLLADDWEIAS